MKNGCIGEDRYNHLQRNKQTYVFPSCSYEILDHHTNPLWIHWCLAIGKLKHKAYNLGCIRIEEGLAVITVIVDINVIIIIIVYLACAQTWGKAVGNKAYWILTNEFKVPGGSWLDRFPLSLHTGESNRSITHFVQSNSLHWLHTLTQGLNWVAFPLPKGRKRSWPLSQGGWLAWWPSALPN